MGLGKTPEGPRGASERDMVPCVSSGSELQIRESLHGVLQMVLALTNLGVENVGRVGTDGLSTSYPLCSSSFLVHLPPLLHSPKCYPSFEARPDFLHPILTSPDSEFILGGGKLELNVKL